MSSALRQQLNDELKAAMRSRETLKVSVLRLLLSSIHNTEIARQKELDDGEIIGVIAKEIKQRQESIEAYKQGNRDDLVANETAEMEVLSVYMPEQLSREDLEAEVKKVIEEVGAQSIRDKGKVMPKVIAVTKGKADGKLVNEIVTQLLNS